MPSFQFRAPTFLSFPRCFGFGASDFVLPPPVAKLDRLTPSIARNSLCHKPPRYPPPPPEKTRASAPSPSLRYPAPGRTVFAHAINGQRLSCRRRVHRFEPVRAAQRHAAGGYRGLPAICPAHRPRGLALSCRPGALMAPPGRPRVSGQLRNPAPLCSSAPVAHAPSLVAIAASRQRVLTPLLLNGRPISTSPGRPEKRARPSAYRAPCRVA